MTAGDPNCTNTNGDTPLILCLANQFGEPRLKTLKILMEENKSRKEGTSPRRVNLNIKDREQRRNAFQLLLNKNKAAGISTDATIYKSLELLVRSGINVNMENEDGETVLHLLCRNNENIVDAIELLIEKGINVNVQESQGGKTALHHLCRKTHKKENAIEAMKLPIENGADVNLKDTYGHRTALHWLCSNFKCENILDAMRILVETKGADVNLKDKIGRTALHSLCEMYKKENIVQAMGLLIEKGADVNLKDNNGGTALYYLCEKYKGGNIVDAVKILAENGIESTNVKDLYGKRALMDYLDDGDRKEKIVEIINQGKGWKRMKRWKKKSRIHLQHISKALKSSSRINLCPYCAYM